jgi:Flp pilus assembly protein TadB
VNGGLLTLFLLIGILVFGFVGAGRICRRAEQPVLRVTKAPPAQAREPRRPAPPGRRRRRPRPRRSPQGALGWALGCTMFIHAVMFVGVTYFGQSIVVWYISLAFVGSLMPAPRRRRRRRRARRRARPVDRPLTLRTVHG